MCRAEPQAQVPERPTTGDDHRGAGNVSSLSQRPAAPVRGGVRPRPRLFEAGRFPGAEGRPQSLGDHAIDGAKAAVAWKARSAVPHVGHVDRSCNEPARVKNQQTPPTHVCRWGSNAHPVPNTLHSPDVLPHL